MLIVLCLLVSFCAEFVVSSSAMRKVYIDAGAKTGDTTTDFFYGKRDDKNDFEVYSFEMNPKLLDSLHMLNEGRHPTLRPLPANKSIHIRNEAVWIENGFLEMHSDTREKLTGASVMNSPYATGKKIRVPSIDMSEWILNTFDAGDYIVLKIDIEGAEYEVLRKMIVTGAMCRINELKFEWHDRFRQDLRGPCCGGIAKKKGKQGCCGLALEAIVEAACPNVKVLEQFDYSAPYEGSAPSVVSPGQRAHGSMVESPSMAEAELIKYISTGQYCAHAAGLDETPLKSLIAHGLNWVRQACQTSVKKSEADVEIFLITTIPSHQSRSVWLHHFVNHYLSNGIKPQNFLILLQVQNNNEEIFLNETLSVLHSFDIFTVDVWRGPYSSTTMHERRKGILHTHVRETDWVLHVDNDILVSKYQGQPFKSFLAKLDLEGYNVVNGHYIDRLAEDGKLREVEMTPSIWDQFPQSCMVSVDIAKAAERRKVIFYKGHLQSSRGGGMAVGNNTKPFETLLEAHHFKFVNGLLDLLKRRVITYKQTGKRWWVQSQNLIDYYEKHGKFDCTKKDYGAQDSLQVISEESNGYHFFGYFDKCPWSSDESSLLGMQYKLKLRKKAIKHPLTVGVFDPNDNYKWTSLADTQAWNFQQGCQLQWVGRGITQTPDTIVFNTLTSSGLVKALVLNIKTKKSYFLSSSIYAVAPDGKYSLTLDYARLHKLRRGYGYYGARSSTLNQKAPDTDGIWRVSIAEEIEPPKLLWSLADQKKNFPGKSSEDSTHWFNHIQISPSGNYVAFLHRHTPGKSTRLFISDPDFKNVVLAGDYDKSVSHYDWRNDEEIVVGTTNMWFHMIKSGSGVWEWKQLPNFGDNGHPTWLAKKGYESNGNFDILSDTSTTRELFLLNAENHQIKRFGIHQVPAEIRLGEFRSDLHPRGSPSGSKFCIDTCDDSMNCQMAVVNLS